MLRRIASLCSFLGILSLAQGASSSTANPSATSTSKAAATHTVNVGDGGFFFTPNTTYANPGDVVQFVFYPTNHSVVRAEYLFPCIPYEDTGLGKIGFFSGFEPVIAIIQGKVKLPPRDCYCYNCRPSFYTRCSQIWWSNIYITY
jgi:plastocyanin